MVIAANTASSAAILAEPTTFDKIWNYFKEVNSTDNINICAHLSSARYFSTTRPSDWFVIPASPFDSGYISTQGCRR
jgi:hypothetical protein